MRRFLVPLAIAFVVQVTAVAQPPPRPSVPRLAAAIADGAPFVLQLQRDESNGTLIGGETYTGRYDRDSDTFTVSGQGLRDDGVVIPVTATYGGADPLWQELSVWGALYTFDSRGNLYLGRGNSARLSGRIWLRR